MGVDGRADLREPVGEVASGTPESEARPESLLWVLKPVVRPDVPVTGVGSANPIDAFVAAEHKRNGSRRLGRRISTRCCAASTWI